MIADITQLSVCPLLYSYSGQYWLTLLVLGIIDTASPPQGKAADSFKVKRIDQLDSSLAVITK